MTKKGYKQTEEHKQAIRNNVKINQNFEMRGKHQKEDSKRKIKVARARQIFSKESIEKRAKSNTGKKRKEETKKRISDALKGRYQTEETQEKIRRNVKKIMSKPKIKEKCRLSHLGKVLWNKDITGYITSRKGQHHKEESIEKIKIARKEQILPMKDTKIEIKIQDFLAELKIFHIKHLYCYWIEHTYQCDIIIPKYNLIIECDGDYWHHYPVGGQFDSIRTQELKNSGFKVIRLWDRDIQRLSLDDLKNKLIQIGVQK